MTLHSIGEDKQLLDSLITASGAAPCNKMRVTRLPWPGTFAAMADSPPLIILARIYVDYAECLGSKPKSDLLYSPEQWSFAQGGKHKRRSSPPLVTPDD